MDLTVLAYATVALSLLVSGVKMGDWILHADPRTIVNAGRWALIALVILAPAVLLWLLVSGRWTAAMILAAFTLPIFVGLTPRWQVLFAPLKAGFPRVRGFGFVTGNPSTARETPNPELVRQSIEVLRIFLKQTGQSVVGEPAEVSLDNRLGNAPGLRIRMSPDEAFEVLGLEPTADAQEILKAYRRLE